jgi:hypothetical protein
MQRELVAVHPHGCNDKVHLMLNQAGDEVNVARQPIEPGNEERTMIRFRLLECGARYALIVRLNVQCESGVCNE